jgi:hypothetical protein
MAATILDFPEMQAPPRTRKMRRGRTSAEIVLFPGIRFERWADDPAKHEAPRIERDRLQLIE